MVDKPGKLLKAEALKAGDRVALLAPASRPHSLVEVARCKSLIEEMGFVPVAGEHVLDTHGYMAGTDEDRLSDLHEAIADDSIKAMFFLAGGFGSLRLLDRLDYAMIERCPKIYLGSDEITSLLLAIRKLTGLVTFYGPNLDRIRSRNMFSRLKEIISSKKPASPIENASDKLESFSFSPVEGKVEGRCEGGNLSAFSSLMGTRYQVDTDGRILFFSDLNERNDILDRWFSNLYVAGRLEKVAGVAFGEFENCGPRDSRNLLSIEDMFSDRLTELKLPSCFNLNFGNSAHARIVPMGVEADFDAGQARLTFHESALI